MTKSHIIYAFSSVVLLAAALVFLAASRSRKEKPELPIMQQFSATPRFENQQTIFGKTYDLSFQRLSNDYTHLRLSFNLFHALFERMGPIGDPNAKSLLDLGLVEHRISGTLDG